MMECNRDICHSDLYEEEWQKSLKSLEYWKKTCSKKNIKILNLRAENEKLRQQLDLLTLVNREADKCIRESQEQNQKLVEALASIIDYTDKNILAWDIAYEVLKKVKGE